MRQKADAREKYANRINVGPGTEKSRQFQTPAALK
jgi:hypothetical protein